MRRYATLLVGGLFALGGQPGEVWAQKAAPAGSTGRRLEAAPSGPAASPSDGQAARPAAARPDPAKSAQMQQLLQSWEQVSQANETLYAEFKRTDASPAFLDGPKQFVGRALLKKPNLACLEFEEVVKDRPKPVFNQRIVCSGDAVYQFLGPTKQVFVFPMAEDERRRALEEGPLPFMFNMRMAAAQERYTWDLLDETETTTKEPGAYIIRIIPRQAIDREEFSQALVKLDKKTFLPIALRLFAPNGKDTKTFEFGKVERNSEGNPAANPTNYSGSEMAAKFKEFGYKVIVNPDSEGAAEAAPAAAGGRAARGSREPGDEGRR